MAALGLVLYNGIVTRPGEPRVADRAADTAGSSRVVGIVLMMVGGAKRATEVERARKPPGVHVR